MPIKIPVVVSQSSNGSPDRKDLEESLVTKLMVEEVADVRIISSLEGVQPDSTDVLMLEQLSNDFALLAWQSADKCVAQLSAIGIKGRRAAHRGDPEAPNAQGRRIYVIDLSQWNRIEEVVEILSGCSTDRATQTVQIGMMPAKSALAKPAGKPIPQIPITTRDEPVNVASVQPIHPDKDELSDRQEESLESLVDQLDDLDL